MYSYPQINEFIKLSLKGFPLILSVRAMFIVDGLNLFPLALAFLIK